MASRKRVILMLGVAACVAAPGPAFAQASWIYLVRHAETEAEPADPADPGLSEPGVARATLLALSLPRGGMTSVYSTPYERTMATAEPIARASSTEVETYDPFDRVALEALLERMKATPGHHLIVGHSNTTPDLVRALGGDPVVPIGESEYDRLYVVVVTGDGEVASSLLRYGEPSEPGIERDRPVPAVPEPARLVEGTASFRMLFEGEPVGTAVYTVERTGDGWVFTETTEVPRFEVNAVSRIEVASDLRPRRFTSNGTMFGGPLAIAVDFTGDRAQGTSVYPRPSGPERLELDMELPEGVVERTQAFFLAAALPYAEGQALGFAWFDTYFGGVQEIAAVVTGSERIVVPAGSFDTWRIDLRGGTPSQVLWVTREAPYRMVRIEVAGQPWAYELVSTEAR